MSTAMRALSVLEARVLAVLVEKAHTVPDSYPLSLNALVAGCNQKTARDPVMSATDADVQSAVDELRRLSLVFESSGSRVSRYEHNFARALGVPSQSVALLSTLMLRGPQTASELRTNAERLHRFADLSSVEGFLEELAERAEEKGGPLVVKLARAPGTRESRWVHQMSGPVDVALVAAAVHEPRGSQAAEASPAVLEALRTLTDEVAVLRAQVQRLSRELGIDLSAGEPGNGSS